MMRVAVYTRREQKIDAQVVLGCELASGLEQLGPLNEQQIKFLITAAAKASKVPDLKEWEIREAAKRVACDFKNMGDYYDPDERMGGLHHR
jgi:hypothetical protein